MQVPTMRWRKKKLSGVEWSGVQGARDGLTWYTGARSRVREG